MTGVLLVGVPGTLGVALWRARVRVRQLEARFRREDPGADDRIDALEQHMDAMAAQIDQIASGQEFLSRLVTQRLERLPSQPQPPRVVTPH